MPQFVSKPWGREEIFAHTDDYVGKILTVRAGEVLSLQYHERKDETMRVLTGECHLHLGEAGTAHESSNEADLEVLVLAPGDICRIPPRTIHRLAALTDTTVLEVSTPHLDDVVRLADEYGREDTSAA